MNLYTEDSIPEFTRIGDKQYHHFTLNISVESQSLMLYLAGETGIDFNLNVNPGDFAFESSAQFTSTSAGNTQMLIIPLTDSDLWYVGVECATTVEATNTVYSGNTSVLNGVAYKITAMWDTLEVVGISDFRAPLPGFELYPNFPNPFNPSTTLSCNLDVEGDLTLNVYDIRWLWITELVHEKQAAGDHFVRWNGIRSSGQQVEAGVYFPRLEFKGQSRSQKLIYLR